MYITIHQQSINSSHFIHHYSLYTPIYPHTLPINRGVNSSTTWNSFSAVKLQQLASLQKLSTTVNTVITNDPKAQRSNLLVDCIYYTLTHVISRTLTLAEFFQNVTYYSTAMDCILTLPNPSDHIQPIYGFLYLRDAINTNKIRETLEKDEEEVVKKLDKICDRLTLSVQRQSTKKRNLDALTLPMPIIMEDCHTVGDLNLKDLHGGTAVCGVCTEQGPPSGKRDSPSLSSSPALPRQQQPGRKNSRGA